MDRTLADPETVLLIGARGATKRGDEPVGPEHHDSRATPDDAPVLSDALPDHPGATDLGERGKDEQQQRAQDGHGSPYESTIGGSRWLSPGAAPIHQSHQGASGQCTTMSR